MHSRLQLFFSRWLSLHSVPRHHFIKSYESRSTASNDRSAFYCALSAPTDGLNPRELHSPAEDAARKSDDSEKGHSGGGSGGEKGKKLGPWRPLKRLTRQEMSHMRSVREMQPEEWTHGRLARVFGVSSSAVRRILRSKFEPNSEVEERQERGKEAQRLKRRERLFANIRRVDHPEPPSEP